MSLNASPLVGIHGVARAGKDSIAEVLVSEFGFVRYAFADRLKQAAYKLNPYIDYSENCEGPREIERHRLHETLREVVLPELVGHIVDNTKVQAILDAINPSLSGITRLSEVIDEFGWEAAKDHQEFGDEIRRFLQHFGTDGVRAHLGDDTWVRAAELHISRDGARGVRPVVIPDVRFDGEAEWIQSQGGVVWEVTRPGFGGANGHVSEQRIRSDLIDVIVANDSTLDDLATKVTQLVFSGATTR